MKNAGRMERAREPSTKMATGHRRKKRGRGEDFRIEKAIDGEGSIRNKKSGRDGGGGGVECAYSNEGWGGGRQWNARVAAQARTAHPPHWWRRVDLGPENG